jgi:hypothetical protein
MKYKGESSRARLRGLYLLSCCSERNRQSRAASCLTQYLPSALFVECIVNSEEDKRARSRYQSNGEALGKRPREFAAPRFMNIEAINSWYWIFPIPIL